MLLLIKSTTVLDLYGRFLHFGGFYFVKMWIFLIKTAVFSGRIWPDWGNTTWADLAGLGSIGLSTACMLVDLRMAISPISPPTLSHSAISKKKHRYGAAAMVHETCYGGI